MSESISDYPVCIRLPIQWGDQDAFGHVNNTIPVRWFESSRIAFLERIQLMHDGRYGPILAAVTANYSHQLHYPDEVVVGARIQRIGNTSMTIDHAVFSQQQQRIAVTGHSVVVMFDYRDQVTIPVSAEAKKKISQLESR